MFDDEGFAVEDSNITYLRNIASKETACRGNKAGQCFAADKPAITISERKLGLPESKAGNYWFPILAVPRNLTCSLRQIMSVLSRQKINVSGHAIAIFMLHPIKES